ncbi:DUF2059 domain-containing protein [Marinobacteraceae bacterium S3BR75-40.1]
MSLRTFALAALCCLSLASAPATWADMTSHEKAASQLLKTMHLDQLLGDSLNAMLQLELQNNPGLRPYEDTMKAFFKKYMSAKSLHDEFVGLYTETFTEEELVEINAFYSTPIGQKMLTTAPDLMAKGAAIGQRRVQENLPELRRMIEEEAQRLSDLQKNNDRK